MKRLIAALFIASLILVIGGCPPLSETSPLPFADQKIEEIKASMRFFKHPASGLCFATASYFPTALAFVMTEVPCEKVEHLLANK
ncbi:MAG: hypothetical protein AAB562_04375 [Patescibacteria group bacterium]